MLSATDKDGYPFFDEDKVRTLGTDAAQRLYLKYLTECSLLTAGSKEIKELQSFLVSDDEFQTNAADILEVNFQGPVWIDAFFRSTAKRSIEAAKIQDIGAYDDNSKFGMF